MTVTNRSESKAFCVRFKVDLASRVSAYLKDQGLTSKRGGRSRLVNAALYEYLSKRGY